MAMTSVVLVVNRSLAHPAAKRDTLARRRRRRRRRLVPCPSSHGSQESKGVKSHTRGSRNWRGSSSVNMPTARGKGTLHSGRIRTQHELGNGGDVELNRCRAGAEQDVGRNPRARARARPLGNPECYMAGGVDGSSQPVRKIFLSIFARAGRNGVESGNHTPMWMGLWMRNIAGQGGRFPKQFNSLPGYLAAHAKQHVP